MSFRANIALNILVVCTQILNPVYAVAADASPLSFYSDTPITEANTKVLLSRLASDKVNLENAGVVFKAVPAMSDPYREAGYEIDFNASHFDPKRPGVKAYAMQWQHVRNYFAIQGQLKKCGVNTGNRDLANRIMKAAAESDPNKLSCQSFQNANLNQDKISSAARAMQGAILSSKLEDTVLLKTAEMSAAQFKYMQTRYPNPVAKPDFCGDYACDKEFSKAVATGLEVARAATQTSIAQVRDQLNGHINDMNGKLGLMKTVSTSRIHAVPKLTPELQKEYDQYTSAYDQATAAPSGELFTTDAVRKKMREEETLKDGGVAWGNKKLLAGGEITWRSHAAVDDTTVSQAITEARKSVQASLVNLNRLYSVKKKAEGGDTRNPTYRSEAQNLKDLKFLTKNNPLAVGRALMEDPSAASEMCSVINSVEKDDIDKARLDREEHNLLVYGGITVGVLALVATGGIFIVGGAAVAGAVTVAGVSTGGLVTMGTTATFVGAGLGVTATGYAIHRDVEHHQDFEEHQSAVLADTGDQQTVAETVQDRRDFEKGRIDVAKSSAITVLDLLGVREFRLAEGATKLVKLSQIEKLIPESFRLGVASSKVRAVLYLEGLAEKNPAFMEYLKAFAHQPESMRLKLLNQMKDWPIPSIQQFAENLLKIPRNMSATERAIFIQKMVDQVEKEQAERRIASATDNLFPEHADATYDAVPKALPAKVTAEDMIKTINKSVKDEEETVVAGAAAPKTGDPTKDSWIRPDYKDQFALFDKSTQVRLINPEVMKHPTEYDREVQKIVSSIWSCAVGDAKSKGRHSSSSYGNPGHNIIFKCMEKFMTRQARD